MKNQLFSRMELSFWNFTIQTLSESVFTQSCLREVYHMLHSSAAAPLGIVAAISGVAGLVSGYLFYFLSSGLR
jgi:hypothetical protein